MRGSMWMLAAVAFGIAAVPTGWWATDEIESDNDFCNTCHLPSGVPLHTALRDDYDGRPPASLAARHASTSVRTRPESPEFRCIDCHGGVGLVGRTRVKLLSIRDGILYLAGDYEEPEGMSWPIRDADCRGCHADFAVKRRGFDGEAFHDRPGHNRDLGVACVACHFFHDTDVRPDTWFLDPDRLRSRCAECHVEYQEAATSSPPQHWVGVESGRGD